MCKYFDISVNQWFLRTFFSLKEAWPFICPLSKNAFCWVWLNLENNSIKKIVKFSKLTSGGRTKIINTTYIFQAFSFGEPKTWSFKYNEYYLVGNSTYLDTLLWKSTPSCSESMETWAFSSVDRVCLQTSVAILILLNDRRLSLISSLYFLWEKIKPEEEYWTKKKFIFHWYFLWLWFNKILQTCKIPEPESLLVHWWICCLLLLVCRCCPGFCRVLPGGEQWRRLLSHHPDDKPEHYWKQTISTVARVVHRKLNAVL